MKIAFIHHERKIGTGAHYINDLMALKLQKFGVEMKNFYPRATLVDAPVNLRGLQNILFFYSLLERRNEMLKFDVIQGTTYTPLPFLAFSVPVVSHFGSTTRGFLNATPTAEHLERDTRKVWYHLKGQGAIKEVNLTTRRPLQDIAEIEEYVATRATACIATSKHVARELVAMGVERKKIRLIHNALEDYWFTGEHQGIPRQASLVFLGRLGSDAFTLKLKGLDRLIHFYQQFPKIKKITFCMTGNKPLLGWMRGEIPLHTIAANVTKDRLPSLLRPLRGSVLFIPSRYEGFSLSLMEGMSQGLIPIVYRVGIAPEVIHHGYNGYLVNSQDEAVRYAEELLGNYELRERMSVQAFLSAREFTGDSIAESLVSLYDHIHPHLKRLKKSL